ncbi:septal ring lytic transglycosylase RlpA family protein [Ferrimonas balearica]|uniref:septal ring lytic transglycosylase RlpA family protein n=1 Tax=Ferrimonas balearica TaxID=44012 RepID=UPI001C59E1DC|nr:septal ring lytic transglycosylase RlpA family protein [Ferrimonas balearica]MBW3137920.1 septal ring lytic transglycosylase RlpA family protein [Ferrimonas balearica]MBY6104926.1 septal ring lytic transglycosylase RlpA family protein [Ferrimonas balearica]
MIKPGRLASLVLAVWLAGCSSSPDDRYQMAQDKAPDGAPDLNQLEPPVPRYEPKSRGGNRDYEVWGKSYQVLPSAEGYVEEGNASWYGAKFHGHLTSNGETYDMFSFSAAHRSLPLPTYAKVTNLSNGKSLVVRINDRGPFHSDRIIDLSYAAAWHLDILKSGTAPVRVEAYHFDGPNSPLPPLVGQPQLFIQLVASGDQSALNLLKPMLEKQLGQPVRIETSGQLHKLQLGPLTDAATAERLLTELRAGEYPQAFKVVEPQAN